ncbi:MAG: carboxypeptidase-like regulatory domain-containing protein [Bacteroidetes bacterium]|nr:carboxypeptidase-like regulatory domain-containing protein [Bacteroidota bacterium]
MVKTSFIAGISLLALLSATAQSSTVRINGTVVDLYNKTPVSGVSVINPKNGQSYVTDAHGTFSITAGKKDTLLLFLSGYQTMRFSMADSAQKDAYYPVFEFDRLQATTTQMVIVRPKQKLSDIEKERENMGKIPRELQRPQMSIMSPISALYDMLSGRAKEREKLLSQVQDDERRRIYKELFNYYKEEKLFDLPDEYYDQFITYLNLPVDFLKYNSDYTITTTILDAYKKFGFERGFIK